MTAPDAPAFASDAWQHFNRLRGRFSMRDRMHATIHEIRNGNIRQLFPEELSFSLSFDGAATSNFIDVVARDMAEGIAPLPAIACASGKMKSQADKQRAETKNRIGENYWTKSKLEVQMFTAADQFVTYGFAVGMIEPDLDRKCPRIRFIDPRHSYYELDRDGDTAVFGKIYHKTVDQLCAEFPEYALAIRAPRGAFGKESPGDEQLEMVQWVDKAKVTNFLPGRDGLVLGSFEHRLSRNPVVIVERPGESDAPRGQFDDVIWVQVARAITAALMLEAQSLAVQSPIAVPSDMDQFAIGPHALLQADNPQNIHRVPLDVPNGIFAENQVLDQELRVGSRYPEARSGDPGTSVITGKGVQALLGAFDSQIKGAQIIWKHGLEALTSRSFEMDEVWWPNESKTVNGTISGTSYEFDYTPAKDINGRWDCTVTYGFAAGLQPEQSAIMMLQLEGAGIISKGTVQDNLPFSIDQLQEQRKIHVERLREGLEQGVLSLLQASGQLAAQGQDVVSIVKVAAAAIQDIENGKPVEDALLDSFQVMEQEKQQQAEQMQQAAAQAQQSQPGGPGADQGGGGGDQGGPGDQQADQQAQIGQAGMPAGGRPSLDQLISGFRGAGNTPVMQAQIRRQIPVGTA